LLKYSARIDEMLNYYLRGAFLFGATVRARVFDRWGVEDDHNDDDLLHSGQQL